MSDLGRVGLGWDMGGDLIRAHAQDRGSHLSDLC